MKVEHHSWFRPGLNDMTHSLMFGGWHCCWPEGDREGRRPYDIVAVADPLLGHPRFEIEFKDGGVITYCPRCQEGVRRNIKTWATAIRERLPRRIQRQYKRRKPKS